MLFLGWSVPLLAEDSGASASERSSRVAIVRAQVKAYNKHDVEALTKLLAENVKWYSVNADKISTEASGRAELKSWLDNYFKEFPDVRSSICNISLVGALVSFREQVSWTKKDGTRQAQRSIAIYEVVDGLITRVWYFPIERLNPARNKPLES
jgi:hypothetical protein